MNNNDFTKLDENADTILGYIFEEAFLIHKTNKKSISLGWFYGNPTCGIISKDSSWCIVGGSKLAIWANGTLNEICKPPFDSVFDMKRINEKKINILIDPWSANASVWELDIETLDRNKIKDFDNYNEKEYTDKVEW